MEGSLGNNDRDPCAHHASGLALAADARVPCHELASLGAWDEAAGPHHRDHEMAGHRNIAAATRRHARDATRTLITVGLSPA